MSGTYARVFKHVNSANEYGHAQRNRDNIKTLKKANTEINEMLKGSKNG